MKHNRKGFTLAELLIVVAIIAVLVAIAIPVFTTQLEKAREATDIANVRSAYATLVADYLTDSKANTIEVAAKQQKDDWQTADHSLMTMVNGKEEAVVIPAKKDKYIVSIDADGIVTVK